MTPFPFPFPILRPAASALTRLFEQDCQLCGACAPAVVCAACAQDLPFRNDPCCPLCGEAGDPAHPCGACVAEPPHFDGTVSAFRYEFPLDRLLQAYKFRANLALTALLADSLAAQIDGHTGSGRGVLPDVIVPMPLAARRLAERGFNQSLLLARVLAERFKLRLAAEGLARVRDTRPQAGLKRNERQSNVKGAFVCDRKHIDWQGLHVAVVDDVMTTGATMSEAARALKQAGVARVEAWAVARALQHQ